MSRGLPKPAPITYIPLTDIAVSLADTFALDRIKGQENFGALEPTATFGARRQPPGRVIQLSELE